jgi:hypothetical protein
LSRVKRVLAALFVSALMMVMMAAPAFAFIHVTVPAGECAASDQAGENPTAGAAILFKNPAQDPPVGNAQGAARSDPNC